MRVYLVTHKNQKISFVFKYSLKGNIAEFKSNFSMSNDMIEAFRDLMPFKEKELENFSSEKWKLELLENGLSFAFFWKKFANTNGNKKRAEKLYKELDDLEKAKSITKIDRYNNNLKLTPGIHKCNAETWLYQKRFNNYD